MMIHPTTSYPGPRVRCSGVKGEMRMMWSPWWPGRRRPAAEMRVVKESSQNRSAMGADC